MAINDNENKPKRGGAKKTIQQEVVVTPAAIPIQVNVHHDNMLELLRQLEGVMDFVNGIKDITFGGIRHRIIKHINQDVVWLNSMTGNVTNIDRHAGLQEMTNPLLGNNHAKKIMGVEVGRTDIPVSKEQLKPKIDEAKAFGENVEAMYKSFPSLRDKDIIAQLDKPGGETLVRGVAKIAGIKDWENVECDVVLFADIREAIGEKAKAERAQKEIDESLDEEEGGSDETDQNEG